MKLEEIANITVGVLTRREEEENGVNSYLLFSLKEYDEGREYKEFKTNKDLSNRVAIEGDLLFRLLYPNKIIYVDKTLEGKLIPSQFCIIRITTKEIDPIVLKWYLENEKIKEELENRLTGSIIKTMQVSNLKTLNIPSISNDEQEKIRKLIILWEQEKSMSKELLNEKDKLYNSYIEKILKMEEGYNE